VSSPYRIASPFLIRLAGVPFDPIESLGTRQASQTAREWLDRMAQLSPIKTAAEQFITHRDNRLTPEEFTAWRNAVRRGVVLELEKIPDALRDYTSIARELHAASSQLDRDLENGVAHARRLLFEISARFLPPYLLFGTGQTHHLLDLPSPDADLPSRNSRARERERHLLLYLQRIAAKNDTFSQFGPSAWGHTRDDAKPMTLEITPGVARRQTFPERWTAHALAAALSADPLTFPELRPRMNPNGRLVGNRFIFADGSPAIENTAEQMEILVRSDGVTPICYLVNGVVASEKIADATTQIDPTRGSKIIRELIDSKILIIAMEVPAMEPFAFEVLHRDIKSWRDTAGREKWLPVADTLVELAARFCDSSDPAQRSKIMSNARDCLAGIGVEKRAGSRALYAAANPIAEDCSRECTFEIGEALLDEVVTEAEPWINFWRDSYAFVAGRVAANLRSLLEKAPTENGALPLPAFLRFCESAKLPLTGPGLVGMAHIAFQEVKAAFRERLQAHAQQAEYELTADDCAVVRKTFSYAKFDEFTYPSADLQLAAESVEAVNRGEYRWIIGELHPAVATLHHCMYWSCPDKSALSRALQSMIKNKPFFHFGFFAADFTAHTTIRVFDALPQHAIFASPQRADPQWRYVPPSEAEVFVDDGGDVGLRRGDEYLGSFARNWVIALGFHPFLFTIAPHTPRLRCGRVIVQRRAWSVTTEELGTGNFSGVSRDLVIAVERLRAAKDWPRFVYIRPSETALRRAGAENRDKDTKPVFIDLESYLFLEIFHRWLTKADELEVTEMLPAPNELLWSEADGRRTFELRTLICPR
jgi:hypothetical protein